jgi:hypothetical protein
VLHIRLIVVLYVASIRCTTCFFGVYHTVPVHIILPRHCHDICLATSHFTVFTATIHYQWLDLTRYNRTFLIILQHT